MKEFDATLLQTGIARKRKALVIRRKQVMDMITQEKNRLAAPKSECVNLIRKHLQFLENQVKTLDEQIQEMMQQSEELCEKTRLLQSVPGIGVVTSGIMTAILPELGMLNARKISRLCGLAPMNQDSGKYEKRRKTEPGRSLVKYALNNAVRSAVRFNPTVKAIYDRVRSRTPHEKIARVAAMHKLLLILNAILKTQTPWQPTRL